MTNQVADLELTLRRCEAAGPSPADNQAVFTYAVEMRFSTPDSDTDTRVGVDQPITVCFDFDQLRAASGDAGNYARLLTSSLFASPDFRREFSNVRVSTESSGQALRVRLLTDAAPELLNLRWEALLDPERDVPLFTGEQVYLSRFLVSRDWRPVQIGPKGDLRALIAVANPSDLSSTYNLASIDPAAEIARAKTGLGELEVTCLPEDGTSEPCTLNRLIEYLRQGGPDGQGYDILFLVCHGAYIREEPWLLLQDESGKADRVPGAELANRINELEKRPRLVVLASCQSAGVSAGQALTALGPRLAGAGVPAVLAMQGSVSMATMEEFLPVFFSELMSDGQIDRALAVARGVVRDHPDCWMPVLFMRLKSGRLWYTPGFGEDGSGFKKWSSLLSNLKRGACTPIIGPGITDELIGSTRDIASRWAEDYGYPMEVHERDQLPQVAQYLSIKEDYNFPRYQLIDFIRQQTLQRFRSQLSEELKTLDADLDRMLEMVMQIRANSLAAQGRVEPHRLLASLPLPIYITTSYTDLLASALRAAGKNPEVGVCPWNDSIIDINPNLDANSAFRPTAAQPVVYHLFGRFDQPVSLVLTEDDYFDFLIGVTRNEDLIPSFIRKALVSSSLLFVGFQLDDWDFRVLYRTIMGKEGGNQRSRFTHVGVQVDNESADIADPNRARSYLENYFDDSSISLYWGGSEDFIQELSNQLKAKP